MVPHCAVKLIGPVARTLIMRMLEILMLLWRHQSMQTRSMEVELPT